MVMLFVERELMDFGGPISTYPFKDACHIRVHHYEEPRSTFRTRPLVKNGKKTDKSGNCKYTHSREELEPTETRNIVPL